MESRDQTHKKIDWADGLVFSVSCDIVSAKEGTERLKTLKCLVLSINCGSNMIRLEVLLGLQSTILDSFGARKLITARKRKPEKLTTVLVFVKLAILKKLNNRLDFLLQQK